VGGLENRPSKNDMPGVIQTALNDAADGRRIRIDKAGE